MEYKKYIKIKTVYFFRKNIQKQTAEYHGTDYLMKEVNFDSLTQYPDLFYTEYYEEYKNRFLNGAKCFILFYKFLPVQISWVILKSLWIEESEEILYLDQNEICIFDVFTIETRRRQGFFQFAQEIISNWAREQNIKYLIIYAEKSNIPSINAIVKSGFKRYKRSTLLKFFIIKFHL